MSNYGYQAVKDQDGALNYHLNKLYITKDNIQKMIQNKIIKNL